MLAGISNKSSAVTVGNKEKERKKKNHTLFADAYFARTGNLCALHLQSTAFLNYTFLQVEFANMLEIQKFSLHCCQHT